MLTPGQSYLSSTPTLYVYFESRSDEKGYSADVTFVDVPSCT